MNFGACNERTLMDSATRQAREENCHHCQRTEEMLGGYTYFFLGVRFAMRNQLISHPSELPVGISEHLMTLYLVCPRLS